MQPKMDHGNNATGRTSASGSHGAGKEEMRAPVDNFQLASEMGSEVEEIHNYKPGGYHPVAIGDLLGTDNRFRVVQKLGHGGYATVWLCHDMFTRKWRAIKIMAA